MKIEDAKSNGSSRQKFRTENRPNFRTQKEMKILDVKATELKTRKVMKILDAKGFRTFQDNKRNEETRRGKMKI